MGQDMLGPNIITEHKYINSFTSSDPHHVILLLTLRSSKELALDILNQSLQLKLEVNTVTYNAAISACETLVLMESSHESFHLMG